MASIVNIIEWDFFIVADYNLIVVDELTLINVTSHREKIYLFK